MLAQPPPVRIIAPGRVYRKDDDPTHSPMFSQIEGLLVDEGVSFADLKGTLLYFVRRLLRSRHRHAPAPLLLPLHRGPAPRVDIQCFVCRGTGCRTCKGTGFIEILGCGMVDPEVFRHVGYDSERYSGFAFGMGIERIALPPLRGSTTCASSSAATARFTRQFS